MALTREQFDRWKDLACRMARTWYPDGVSDPYVGPALPYWDPKQLTFWPLDAPKRHGEPKSSKDHVIECVEEFFDLIFRHKEWYLVISYDHSDAYPDGPHYGHRTPPPVCDKIREMAENWNPWYWRARYQDDPEPELPYEHQEDYVPLYEDADEIWVQPIDVCVRASLDMVGEMSAGVVGFTAGDVRALYPEGMPRWLLDAFNEDPQEVTTAACSVGMVIKEKKPGLRFEDVPDDMPVWL